MFWLKAVTDPGALVGRRPLKSTPSGQLNRRHADGINLHHANQRDRDWDRWGDKMEAG
jgi:hypothetical protein